ncbi:hypothetical protein TNCV_2666301 [Trichonephila clavipes]|nr:hypothetical protein TNCV_2666301 [Trichonephila clavipes]
MTVPLEQSVNGLCNTRFAIWYSGSIDLREYHCLIIHHRAVRLAWTRQHRDWSAHDEWHGLMRLYSDYLTPTGG